MVLQYQLAYIQHTLRAATLRKERLEELMSRKKAKKWDQAKKATMVRRLVTATQTIEQCVAAADEVAKKLEGVIAKLQNNAAAFIQPPSPGTATATTVSENENPFGG